MNDRPAKIYVASFLCPQLCPQLWKSWNFGKVGRAYCFWLVVFFLFVCAFVRACVRLLHFFKLLNAACATVLKFHMHIPHEKNS